MTKLSFKNSFILLTTAVLVVSGFLVSAGTASADTVYGVTQITAVKTYAVPGGDYANGWSWVLNVTVPTNETILNMQFDNWTGILGNIPAASNLQFYSAQSSNAYDEAHAISITAANTYSSEMDLIPASDLSPRAGKQIQLKQGFQPVRSEALIQPSLELKQLPIRQRQLLLCWDLHR